MKKIEKIKLNDLEFAEKVLRDIKGNNESSNRFNLGIFYGLVFGILGNLFVALFIDYIKEGERFLILIFLIILIIISIWIFIIEDRKFRKNKKNLNLELNKTIALQDRLIEGEEITRKEFNNVIRRH